MDIIKSDIVSLHGAVLSMQGGRSENQDDYCFVDTPLGFLLVVCDGMGGGPGGKTASYIVKYEISKVILDCSPQTSRTHAFKMAVARAHEVLEAKMEENPSLNGMGSTFVAILISKQSAVVAHAGDSRCYKIHGKKCLYRSSDHSLVAELVRKKVMTEEEARLSPQSNVITRGLGSTKNQVPEIDEIPYNIGDRFVLCTDGVWGIMPHKSLLDTLTAKSDTQIIVSNLSTTIDKIGFSNGGRHDNHTLAMIEMETPSVLRPQYNWKRLGFFLLIACLIACISALCIWGITLLIDKDKSGMALFDSKITHISDMPTNIYDTKATIGQQSHLDSKVETNNENPKEKVNINKDLFKLNTAKENKVDTDTVRDVTNTTNEKKSPLEIVETIIDRYNNAKEIAEDNIEMAVSKVDAIHSDIVLLLEDLSKQDLGEKERSKMEAICRVVDDKRSWYIDKNSDPSTKKYGLTGVAKGEINKQIKRLNELIKMLQKL